MQRHSGTLPPRRYGPRSRQNHNRHNLMTARNSSTSSQFSSTTSTTTTAAAANVAHASESRSMSHVSKTGTGLDDESLSSVDHSLDSTAGPIHLQSTQNLLSPSANAVSIEAAHSGLKPTRDSHHSAHLSPQQQHHQHHQQHHQLQLSVDQRNNPIAPIAVQFNPRFYSSPSSSITAPLAAHTATWLASGAASAVAGIANSKSAAARVAQYDTFLSSYAGFAGQHPGQHLTRLTLLPPTATHVVDQHHQHHTTTSGSTSDDKNRESGLQMQQQQQEYGSQQPNPDFSQLLD